MTYNITWQGNSDTEWKIKKKPKVEENRNVKCLIKQKAVTQIRSLCNEYETLEWIAGLKGTITDKEITINEIKLFEQEVQGAFCEFTNDGSIEMAQSDCIGWIHSHNKMGVFFSGQDEETSKFNQVSIVVNNKLEMVGKFRAKIMGTVDAYATLQIFYEVPENRVDPEILAEKLKEQIEKKYEKVNIKVKELELEVEEEIDEKFLEAVKPLITEKSYTNGNQTTLNRSFENDDEEEILTWDELSNEEKESIRGQPCTVCSNKIKKKRVIVYKDEPYHRECFDQIEGIVEEIKDDDYYDEYGYCNYCQSHKNACTCYNTRSYMA